MQAWWEAMTVLEKVFTCIAIPSTMVLVLQIILLLIGIGHDSDVDTSTDVDADVDADADVDVDGDTADFPSDGGSHEGISDAGGGLHLFTVRGMVAFFCVMGWTGYALLDAGVGTAVSIIISVLSGLLMMVIVALLLFLMMKLQSNGTMNIRNALGKSGTVYLNIPANRSGAGKVNVVVQGSYSEFDAVTDDAQKIEFGTEIVVVGISGSTTLVVRRK